MLDAYHAGAEVHARLSVLSTYPIEDYPEEGEAQIAETTYGAGG